MNLLWVTIQVKNVEESLAFYRDTLGLTINRRFETPEHEIVMLGQEDAAKIELISTKEIYAHPVCTGVSVGLGIEGLDELVEKLKAQGLPVVGPITPTPQVRFFFVTDPDGYTVQLVEEA